MNTQKMLNKYMYIDIDNYILSIYNYIDNIYYVYLLCIDNKYT